VANNVHLFQINYNDLTDLLPTIRIEKIREFLKNEPKYLKVIDLWIERQRESQWKKYRKNCVKKARTEKKFEKDMTNGTFRVRKSQYPRSFKSFLSN
jgi:hypothetical protein